MLKYFCDFCKNEIGPWVKYSIILVSPPIEANPPSEENIYMENRNAFHLCEKCFEENKKKLNIK